MKSVARDLENQVSEKQQFFPFSFPWLITSGTSHQSI